MINAELSKKKILYKYWLSIDAYVRRLIDALSFKSSVPFSRFFLNSTEITEYLKQRRNQAA